MVSLCPHLNVSECESTISVRIKKSVYDSVLANYKSSNISHDIIFIFSSKSRLSARNVQKKTIIERKRILGFMNGCVYPICRTQANEDTTSIDPDINIEKAIHRLVVKLNSHDTESKKNIDSGCKFRIAYNKEETEDGARYSLTCECEYPQTSNYRQVLEYEKCLVSEIQPFLYHSNAISDSERIEIVPDRLTLGEIFSCVVPKVQMWHCFNPNDEYLWAFKWNGVKAKFMCVNGRAYIWPDASEINSEFYEGDLKFMELLCLQVEILDDQIVIVEVISASFYGEIYSVEPYTNVDMLRYLSTQIKKKNITVGGKLLTVQIYYRSCLPKRFDETKHDGFIIVQQDLVIKWKSPTIDVKCLEPYKFVVGSIDKLIQINIPESNGIEHKSIAGEPGSVYEISSNFKILRKRSDRTTCSTLREYGVFLESIDLINSIIPK